MRVKDIAFVLRRIMGMLLVVCLLPFQVIGGGDSLAHAESFEEYRLLVGDIFTIPTSALNRISITDPEVADISDAKPDELTLMGKTPGQTILFLWEGSEKRSIIIRVIEQDLTVLQARLKSLFDSIGITTIQMNENSSEGKVVLTGSYPEDKEDSFSKIVDPFSEYIIDLSTKEDSKDLVQIDMQITELKTTLSKVMGVDWFSGGEGDQKTDLTWGISEVPPFEGNPQKPNNRIQDLFRIGHFVRTSSIMAQVDALITKGKGTILSKPRIVVKSGKEATFLVGGEIPIKTVTGTAGAGTTITENIEYKEYGVSLSITPTIKEGKIDIELTAEISDIDASAPTTVATNGTSFLTRSAQTELLLDDRQTIVLAGMIRKDRSQFDKRVPILGYIPVLGWIFRSSGSLSPDTDTEVVISLTATILQNGEQPAEKQKPAEVKSIVLDTSEAKETGTTAVALPTSKSKVEVTGTSKEKRAVPPIAKNAGTVSVSVPQAVAPYIQMIQEKISSAIAFPYEAQQNGWQGTVKLSMVIKRDGSLRDVFVKESSGYEIFDQDAINTAQILAPYAPFSDNIKDEELSLTIPIVYSQDSFLKNVAKRK